MMGDYRMSAPPRLADPYASLMVEDSSMVTASTKSTGAMHTKRKDRNSPWFTSRQIRLFRKPPPAEQAAYTGPPRYDWVDIETAAAVKIQAAYRRWRVITMMEEQGRSTAAVRNSSRRRQAAKEATMNPAQDFVNLFACCGVDLGLGGGNQEKYLDITREIETARYQETTRMRQEREELLRKSYKRKSTGMRHSLVENVEVVQ
ncbi:expressed unknown protein [Seminavis robusta]|uniref:Uncharacterized protein n=1 Tax=Seminavis robusta TaxID=568900 RepID=A0A9N8H3M8_9STRA|nr:expressed unknown protein [Seminavis robusta]|eukprot:Sro30_g019530.1 n/a (203) ;mRNA; r:59078-59911